MSLLNIYDKIALENIQTEREFQEEKWGYQLYDHFHCLALMGEEFGEVCEELNFSKIDNQRLYDEIKQVGALAAYWMSRLHEHGGLHSGQQSKLDFG